MKSAHEIRLTNARALLLDQCHGSQAEFQRRTKWPQAYVWQIFRQSNPKNIGPKAARRIEKAFGKAENWLDHEHEHALLVPAVPEFVGMQEPPISWEDQLGIKRGRARDLIALIAKFASTSLLSQDDLKALQIIVKRMVDSSAIKDELPQVTLPPDTPVFHFKTKSR